MLASAAKGGDHPHSVHARNALYLRHFHSINAMLARAKRIVAIVSDTDSSIEAQDVVQQSFLIFCHLLDTWNGSPGEETFLSYLARLMPSHASHFVRDTLHYRARKLVRRSADWALSNSDCQPQFQQTIEGLVGHQAEFENALDAEVQSKIFWSEQTRNLTQLSKRWITLRYSLGLSSVEIADLCGVSPRTVDRELKAALTQIRHQLQSTWENCA